MKNRVLAAFGAALALASMTAAAAQAAPIELGNGSASDPLGSLTVGPITFKVASCSSTGNDYLCTHWGMVPDGPYGFKIVPLSGSGPLIDTTGNPSQPFVAYEDASVDFQITSAVPVTSLTLGVSGQAVNPDDPDYDDVNVGYVLDPAITNDPTDSVDTQDQPTLTIGIADQTKFEIQTDINVSNRGLLNNVSLSVAIPEPASVGLLGFALAGLARMRRRRS